MKEREIFKKGSIQLNQQLLQYEICSLSTVDHSDVVEFEMSSEKTLTPLVYRAFPPERVLSILKQGMSMGAFVDSRIVAIRLIEAPLNYSQSVYRHCGIPASEQSSAVDFCGIVVLPEYRRYGLATQLTLCGLEKLREEGWKHGFATIAPNNYPSLKYFFEFGFEAFDIQKKGDAGDRLLFYGNLKSKLQYTSVKTEMCSVENRKELSRFFAKGFRAVGVKLQKDQIFLEFIRN